MQNYLLLSWFSYQLGLLVLFNVRGATQLWSLLVVNGASIRPCLVHLVEIWAVWLQFLVSSSVPLRARVSDLQGPSTSGSVIFLRLFVKPADAFCPWAFYFHRMIVWTALWHLPRCILLRVWGMLGMAQTAMHPHPTSRPQIPFQPTPTQLPWVSQGYLTADFCWSPVVLRHRAQCLKISQKCVTSFLVCYGYHHICLSHYLHKWNEPRVWPSLPWPTPVRFLLRLRCTQAFVIPVFCNVLCIDGILNSQAFLSWALFELALQRGGTLTIFPPWTKLPKFSMIILYIFLCCCSIFSCLSCHLTANAVFNILPASNRLRIFRRSSGCLDSPGTKWCLLSCSGTTITPGKSFALLAAT